MYKRQTEAPVNVGNATVTPETYQGESWWRVVNTTANHGARKMIDLSELVNGVTYTASWEVLNDGATPVTFNVDFCDAGLTTYTIAPGEQRRVWATGGLATDTSTYRFTDLAPSVAGSSLLVRNVMVERGNRPRPYFNGDSLTDAGLTFSWLGTAGASPSAAMGPSINDPGPYSADARPWITTGVSPTGGGVGAIYPQWGNGYLSLIHI